MERRIWIGAFTLLPCIALIGCATANIQGDTAEGVKYTRPTAIYFTALDTSTGTWKADSDHIADLKSKVSAAYATLMPKDMAEVAPTAPSTGSETSGWLIKAQVDNCDPGSATMRVILGMGAGQSKLACTFTITNLAHPDMPPIVLHSKGDSGTRSDFTTEAMAGPAQDMSRTVRELRDYIEKFTQ